jgi:aminoglycoside phosphotransferase (APT) family kinase protein
MPAPDVDVSVELVRQLLAQQHPDLASLAVGVLANGWDNVICTVGTALLARLPRRAQAAKLVAHEQRWLPVLAAKLPLPIPAPVRVGQPAHGFPWKWSLVPFLPGQIAALTPPDDLTSGAVALGEFLAALHVAAPPDAPVNPFRGGPLADRAQRVTEHLDLTASGPLADAARPIWDSAIAAAPWAGPPTWVHGDLHPANILVNAGRINAVIDFGDLTSGDPATDLSVAWMVLPAKEREIFRHAYGQADDDTWARARGWALSLALVFMAFSADNPLMAGIGQRTLREVLK